MSANYLKVGIKSSNGKWHTVHSRSEGYDKVVIIPRNTPDGTYNVTLTITKLSIEKPICIVLNIDKEEGEASWKTSFLRCTTF